MEWVTELDRIDHLLQGIGVPSEIRGKARDDIAAILAEAGKQRRDRRQLVLEAIAKSHGNVRKAARMEGWSHETFYAVLRRKIVKSDAAA